MGNLHSIAKAMEHVAADARVMVSHKPDEIRAADRVVLPGVGSIGHCMEALVDAGLDRVTREAAGSKPMLGICVGMQLLLDRSEENSGTDCLGLVAGQVRRFADGLVDHRTGERLKVPHMGWNKVTHSEHPLWEGIAQDSRFYFVHSYYADPADTACIVGTTEYDTGFCCALARDNLFAVQFHPEKSQHVGLALLKNFSNWNGQPS